MDGARSADEAEESWQIERPRSLRAALNTSGANTSELKAFDRSRPLCFSKHAGQQTPYERYGSWCGIRRMGINSSTETSHGWRATARTLAIEKLGIPDEIAEMQLSHVVRDLHGRAYNRTRWSDERRQLHLMQRWADYLNELRTTRPDGAAERTASVEAQITRPTVARLSGPCGPSSFFSFS